MTPIRRDHATESAERTLRLRQVGWRMRSRVCARNSISSRCPSLELLPETVICALALQFDRPSPTVGSRGAGFDRCGRGGQVDPAMPLPGARTGAHILRVLRECRSGFGTHERPNSSAAYEVFLCRTHGQLTSCERKLISDSLAQAVFLLNPGSMILLSDQR